MGKEVTSVKNILTLELTENQIMYARNSIGYKLHGLSKIPMLWLHFTCDQNSNKYRIWQLSKISKQSTLFKIS